MNRPMRKRTGLFFDNVPSPIPPFVVHSCAFVILLSPLSCFSCFSWFIPTQWTRGGIAARARPRAPSTHYLLLPLPFSLPDGIPLHSVHALPSSPSSLLPTSNRRAGAPKRAIHVLPSPPFSLLPTFKNFVVLLVFRWICPIIPDEGRGEVDFSGEFPL